jgi:hypothetical protein
MAKPIDPRDSEVKHVATQYVAEIVRQTNFDEVIAKSSLGRGCNVILFDKREATVRDVALCRVKEQMYDFELESPSAF